MNGSNVAKVYQAFLDGEHLVDIQLVELHEGLNFLIDFNIGVGNKVHVRSYLQDQYRIKEILKAREIQYKNR